LPVRERCAFALRAVNGDHCWTRVFCTLTRRQAALYQQAVTELAGRLAGPEVEGIQRRGIILAFLTRFKQIRNHPS